MTSTTTKGLLNILEYLDTVKTDIPEGIFLTLCNQLGEIYKESKEREDQLIDEFNDVKTVVEFEKEAQKSVDEQECWEYLQITYQMESVLKKLQHTMEYKMIKKNEYSDFTFSDIETRLDDLNDILE